MQVNTVVYKGSDWFLKVHTMLAQYQGKGKYYTCCSVRFNSGASIALLSTYTKSEETAINMHKEICLRAKALFDLK
jgi:hypothetical protein